LKLFSKHRARDKPQNALGGGVSFPMGGTISGQLVNERTAMTVTAVYACVRILSEAIASLPLHVYRYRPDGGKEHYIDHPLYFLLHDEANPEMTSFVWRETMMAHILLHGNAFSQIIRDGNGQVLTLHPLLPNRMTVDRDAAGRLVYEYRKDSGQPVPLRREDVLHIPGLGFDGLVGYSPIAMAKNAVGLALATEEFGATFFSNGANPGGVLESPGVISDPERLKESWHSQFSGSRAHSIAVLEEGLKFHTIGIPPEQAQFLESRKFQLTEIARIFRVPPSMIADLDRATFSNIEHLSLDFVKFTLGPWVARWEACLRQALLLPGEKRGVFIKFNLDGLLRGSYKERMDGYAVGIQNGFFSINDVRALEDMNPAPGGDIYRANGNMRSLESLDSAGQLEGDNSS
jgi:HK97 family phage portal protein